jgi:hypothetical protein
MGTGPDHLPPGANARGDAVPLAHSWPRALRRVRGWLDPWSCLWRCWRAWSSAPPPPELQALLDAVAAGRPLNLYLRC